MNMRTQSIISIFTCFFIGAFAHLTWIATRLQLPGDPAPPGAPWPWPKDYQPSTNQKTWNPSDFSFTSDTSGCDVIDKAFERYDKINKLLTDGNDVSGLSKLAGVTVSVTDKTCGAGHYPSYDSIETYSLVIDGASSAKLNAQTIWGALRGLETLSQLLHMTDETREYFVNQTMISDEPRYQHRGLMVDTARHFEPMSILLSILDGMSYDKLNVFHWHVVDDQSWPYPSRTFPNLTVMGTYSPAHRYSRADVTTILEEARLRGIRVIPEFDTPGHSWSWGRALPRLLTPCWGKGEAGGPFVPNYPLHTDAEILNPMDEYTFDFLDQLYDEIVADFPDEYVHLGMDEAYYSCWESSPNITAWMQQMGFTEYFEIENYYADRLTEIVERKNAKYIIWQDPIDHGAKNLAADTIVEVWKDVTNSDMFEVWQNYANTVADLNYQMILSAPWYLNMITYGQDWRKYYSEDPNNFTTDPLKHALMRGGEACVWAEYIDGTNIISRIWPRLSSIAERLWSPAEINDEEEAKYRLDQQRCRFVRRGIPSAPILNGYCGDYEWGMNVEEPATGAAVILSVATNTCTLLATIIISLMVMLN